MEERKTLLANECDFRGVRPIMMELPYPAIWVKEKNTAYANLLSIDYCGAVSELSAIAQYINNENRISAEYCSLGKTILGIGMAEMMHLQKLGELIFLLGGEVDFQARSHNGRPRLWTPEYLEIPENVQKMLLADRKAEEDAIGQYKRHMSMIRDECVNAVLARIIQDEEYHIMLLNSLLGECGC